MAEPRPALLSEPPGSWPANFGRPLLLGGAFTFYLGRMVSNGKGENGRSMSPRQSFWASVGGQAAFYIGAMALLQFGIIGPEANAEIRRQMAEITDLRLQINTANAEISALEARINADVKMAGWDRVYYSQIVEWIYSLRNANPSMSIPPLPEARRALKEH